MPQPGSPACSWRACRAFLFTSQFCAAGVSWANRTGDAMSDASVSRRSFLGASAAGSVAGIAALSQPGIAAAQAIGVKVSDLPDLAIKEVKVYVIGRQKSGTAVTNAGYSRIAAIVTNS